MRSESALTPGLECVACNCLVFTHAHTHIHVHTRTHTRAHTVLENLDRERKDLPNEEAIYLVAPEENVSLSALQSLSILCMYVRNTYIQYHTYVIVCVCVCVCVLQCILCDCPSHGLSLRASTESPVTSLVDQSTKPSTFSSWRRVLTTCSRNSVPASFSLLVSGDMHCGEGEGRGGRGGGGTGQE